MNVNGPASLKGRWRKEPTCSSSAAAIRETCERESVDAEGLDERDDLRTLIADNDLDPAFCAALFYGTDNGANTYLALAAAGRSGDQEFVDQLVHAAAIAGITRGELMTKVAYHQMQSWRHSNTAIVIKGSMPPGGVPSNRGLIGSTMTGYGLLGLQFRPGGPWDAKPDLDNMRPSRPNSEFRSYYVRLAEGKEVNYDVYGNIQFGYMMSEFGVPAVISIPASHPDFAGASDPGDDMAIHLGYKLRELYPAGVTLEQFEEFMTSPLVIEQLTRGGKIQSVREF